MIRSQKREKPNLERNILSKKNKKQERRGNNSTKLTLLKLGFPEKIVGKIADFGLEFSFKRFWSHIWNEG